MKGGLDPNPTAVILP